MAACSLHAQALRPTTAELASAPASKVTQSRSACSSAPPNQQQFSGCAIASNKSGNFPGASLVCRAGNINAVGTKELMGRSLSLYLEATLPGRHQQQQNLPSLKVEAAKRVQTGRSYVLSSTLKVQEGKEEQAISLCKEILEWGVTKTKDKESGLQVFECNVDPFEKNVYHFWERYDSFQFMNDLRSSPEHTKFMSEVRPFLTGPIGLAAYEYKEGQIGHMMNPIGPKGEGGLDDATGQAGTKQQSSAIGQGLGQLEEEVEEGGKAGAWGLDKMLDKIRGDVKESGWSLKNLFGAVEDKAKK